MRALAIRPREGVTCFALAARRPKKRGASSREPAWTKLSDADILRLRFRDLHLHIEGTWLEEVTAQLCSELAARGLRFRPHFWLSSEWFSPDGVPGIAIPFYLAHPRLLRLERKLMLEVEGGTRTSCLRILRHEAGHAIETAYHLRRRRTWQRVFGSPTRSYPDAYNPRTYSRDFVLHLDGWYAQSHPLEDFAETFAVWLRPRANWRRDYYGWPALKKLEYVDELMREIGKKAPPVRNRQAFEPVSGLRTTLAEHYRARRRYYGVDVRSIFDRDLLELFTAERRAGARSAAAFLRQSWPELRAAVSRWTQQHPYVVEQFLRDMTHRCRALHLRLRGPTADAKMETAILLTMQIISQVHVGRGQWLEL